MRAPNGTLCSSSDILKRKPSAVMEREYLYATSSLTKFHEMNTMDNGAFRGDTIIIERGQNGRPVHEIDKPIKGLRKEWGQIEVLSQLDSEDPSKPRFSIKLDQMYCSCRKCEDKDFNNCIFRKQFLNDSVQMDVEYKNPLRGYRCIYCKSTFNWHSRAMDHQYRCKVTYPMKIQNMEPATEAKLRFIEQHDDNQNRPGAPIPVQSSHTKTVCAKCDHYKWRCTCIKPKYGGILHCTYDDLSKEGVHCMQPELVQVKLISNQNGTNSFKIFHDEHTNLCYIIDAIDKKGMWVVAIDDIEIRSEARAVEIMKHNSADENEDECHYNCLITYPKDNCNDGSVENSLELLTHSVAGVDIGSNGDSSDEEEEQQEFSQLYPDEHYYRDLGEMMFKK